MLESTIKKYLITVYELSLRNNKVCSKNIAESLNVEKSTVSKILKLLSSAELIDKENYSNVNLTKNGMNLANKYFTQYQLLYCYYMNKYNMSEDIAKHDAIVSICKFSDRGIEAIINYILNNNTVKQNNI